MARGKLNGEKAQIKKSGNNLKRGVPKKLIIVI